MDEINGGVGGGGNFHIEGVASSIKVSLTKEINGRPFVY